MLTVLRNWMGQVPKLSPKFWYLLICLLCSLLFFLFQGGKLATMLLFTVVILTVYLGLGRWSGISSVRGVRNLLNVGLNRTVQAGTSISVELNMQIPGFWPVPYVIVKDELVRRGGEKLVAESSAILSWKRYGIVKYVTKPLRRGFYHFDKTYFSTEDIFGLFEHKGELELAHSFSVMPRKVAIKEWKQFDRMFKGHHHHSNTTKALRETTQINGIREYVYGDRLSRIHWNATAKTGTWKSKEFERESLPKMILLLDRYKRAYADKEQFELAVSAAASLLDFGRKEGLAIGMLSVGAHSSFFDSQRNESHYHEMMRHLVEVEADGFHPLLQILQDRARYFSPGSFFIVLSPQYDESVLKGMHWINQRQMNPCHLLVGSGRNEGKEAEWKQLLSANGFLGYIIQKLEDLPDTLGGALR